MKESERTFILGKIEEFRRETIEAKGDMDTILELDLGVLGEIIDIRLSYVEVMSVVQEFIEAFRSRDDKDFSGIEMELRQEIAQLRKKLRKT